MHRLLIISLALLLGACASSPDSAMTDSASGSTADAVAAVAIPDTAAAASTRAVDDGPDIQCKRVKQTGTRFARKVCTTRDQRETAAAAAANSARDWTLRNTQAGGPLEGG
ncbi:MAG: starvation-inducible outer membrane lipoprotein [Halieaceae bacterium]|jgi:starvation-inducible outer membrane lipoprotein